MGVKKKVKICQNKFLDTTCSVWPFNLWLYGRIKAIVARIRRHVTFMPHCCIIATLHFTPLSPHYSFFKTSFFLKTLLKSWGDEVIEVISKENQHFLSIGGGRNFYFQKPPKKFKKSYRHGTRNHGNWEDRRGFLG